MRRRHYVKIARCFRPDDRAFFVVVLKEVGPVSVMRASVLVKTTSKSSEVVTVLGCHSCVTLANRRIKLLAMLSLIEMETGLLGYETTISHCTHCQYHWLRWRPPAFEYRRASNGADNHSLVLTHRADAVCTNTDLLSQHQRGVRRSWTF